MKFGYTSIRANSSNIDGISVNASITHSSIFVDESVKSHFQRIQLAYFRYPPDFQVNSDFSNIGSNYMTPMILKRFGIHNYPPYSVSRNIDLWKSRKDFLDYVDGVLSYIYFSNIYYDTLSKKLSKKDMDSFLNQFITDIDKKVVLLVNDPKNTDNILENMHTLYSLRFTKSNLTILQILEWYITKLKGLKIKCLYKLKNYISEISLLHDVLFGNLIADKNYSDLNVSFY